MCDNMNPTNVTKLSYTCKPGHGQPNNTDNICTTNNESNKVLYNNARVLGDKGVALSTCCTNVIHNNTIVESNSHLSKKCLNDK